METRYFISRMKVSKRIDNNDYKKLLEWFDRIDKEKVEIEKKGDEQKRIINKLYKNEGFILSLCEYKSELYRGGKHYTLFVDLYPYLIFDPETKNSLTKLEYGIEMLLRTLNTALNYIFEETEMDLDGQTFSIDNIVVTRDSYDVLDDAGLFLKLVKRLPVTKGCLVNEESTEDIYSVKDVSNDIDVLMYKKGFMGEFVHGLPKELTSDCYGVLRIDIVLGKKTIKNYSFNDGFLGKLASVSSRLDSIAFYAFNQIFDDYSGCNFMSIDRLSILLPHIYWLSEGKQREMMEFAKNCAEDNTDINEVGLKTFPDESLYRKVKLKFERYRISPITATSHMKVIL